MTLTRDLLAASTLAAVCATAAVLFGDRLIHPPKPVLSAALERTATNAIERSYERLLRESETSEEQRVLLPAPEHPNWGNPQTPPDCNDVAMDSLPRPIPPGNSTPAKEAPPVGRAAKPQCKPIAGVFGR